MMTASETRLVHEWALSQGVEVEPEAYMRIGRFLDLLMVWNDRIHLTGERDRSALVKRHVTDCLAPCAHLPEEGLVVDLGSGGGFPGIVLGCARPDLEIALVESRRRRASFLGEVIRSVPIPHARVVAERLDGSAPPPEIASRARVAVGRGLRVEEFLDLAAPLLAADGMALSMQVPAARKQASAAAVRAGYRLTCAHDYRLPDGTPRSLLLFVPDRPRSRVS